MSFQKVLDGRGRAIRGLWERNGIFYAQLRLGGKSPRRIPLKECKTRYEAEEALDKLRQQRTEGDLPVLGRTPKLGEYVDDYLKSIKDVKRPGTYSKESGCLNKWKSRLGEIRLNELRPGHIDDFIIWRRQNGASGRTCDLDVIALRNLLKRARRYEFVGKNLPTDLYENQAKPAPKRPLWTPADIQRLVSAVITKRLRTGRQVADYILLCAFSGARRDEAIRLKWSDVNFQLAQLTIGSDGLAKNHESRTVDFNPSLEAHLKEMQTRRDPEIPWMFPSPHRGSGSEHAVTFKQSIELARTDAKMETFQVHDLRHYFISQAVMAGIDYMTIARWVGHKDGGVLIGKVYGHLSNEHAKRMAAKLALMPIVTKPKKAKKTKPAEASDKILQFPGISSS